MDPRVPSTRPGTAAAGGTASRPRRGWSRSSRTTAAPESPRAKQAQSQHRTGGGDERPAQYASSRATANASNPVISSTPACARRRSPGRNTAARHRPSRPTPGAPQLIDPVSPIVGQIPNSTRYSPMTPIGTSRTRNSSGQSPTMKSRAADPPADRRGRGSNTKPQEPHQLAGARMCGPGSGADRHHHGQLRQPCRMPAADQHINAARDAGQEPAEAEDADRRGEDAACPVAVRHPPTRRG